jgi:signal transduction histidine kinase
MRLLAACLISIAVTLSFLDFGAPSTCGAQPQDSETAADLGVSQSYEFPPGESASSQPLESPAAGDDRIANPTSSAAISFPPATDIPIDDKTLSVVRVKVTGCPEEKITTSSHIESHPGKPDELVLRARLSDPSEKQARVHFILPLSAVGVDPIPIGDETTVRWEWTYESPDSSCGIYLAVGEKRNPYELWSTHSIFAMPLPDYDDEPRVWTAHRERVLDFDPASPADPPSKKIDVITFIIRVPFGQTVRLRNISVGDPSGIELTDTEIAQEKKRNFRYPQSAIRVQLSDLDFDGDLDLVAAGGSENCVRILENLGTGEFKSGMILGEEQNRQRSFSGLDVWDIDGDKDLDILATTQDEGFYVYENRLSREFSIRDFSFGGGHGTYACYGLSSGDLNLDGRRDFHLSFAFDRMPHLMLWQRSTEFANHGDSLILPILESKGALPCPVDASLIADIDNDSHLDLLLPQRKVPGGQEHAELYVLKGNGTGRMAFFEATRIPPGVQGIAVGDIDNDGDLDLFLPVDVQSASEFSNRNCLLLNDGEGRFMEVTASWGLAGEDVPSGRSMFLDFDNDGHLDVVVINRSGLNSFFRNTGDGTFEDIAGMTELDDLGGRANLAAGDVDNDGDIDIVAYDAGSVIKSVLNAHNRNDYLRVRFPGRVTETDLVGTRVYVYEDGSERALLAYRQVLGSDGFGCGVEPGVHVGLGNLKEVDVEIFFADGSKYVAEGVRAGTILDVISGGSIIEQSKNRVLGYYRPWWLDRVADFPVSSVLLLVVGFSIAAGAASGLFSSRMILYVLGAILVAVVAYSTNFSEWTPVVLLPAASITLLLGAHTGTRKLAEKISTREDELWQQLLEEIEPFRHSGWALSNLSTIGRRTEIIATADPSEEWIPKVNQTLSDSLSLFRTSVYPRIARLRLISSGIQDIAYTGRALDQAARELNHEFETYSESGQSIAYLRANRSRLLSVHQKLEKAIREVLSAVDAKFSCDVVSTLKNAFAAGKDSFQDLRDTDFLEFHVQGAPESATPLEVYADPIFARITAHELTGIIGDMIQNAFEASVEDKPNGIAVSVVDHLNYVLIDVEDTGGGIPEADQRKILEGYSSKRPRGTGLRLASEILDKYGGKIELLRSEVGHGSTFRVTLKRPEFKRPS